jgi:hypothetical protein
MSKLAEVLNLVRHSVETETPLAAAAFLVGSAWVQVTATGPGSLEELEGYNAWLGALGSALGASDAVYAADAFVTTPSMPDPVDAVVAFNPERTVIWRHNGPRIWYPLEVCRTTPSRGSTFLLCAVACPGPGWLAGVQHLLANRPAMVLDVAGLP